MEDNTRHDPHAVVRDPEMMARFERNVRSIGVSRRRFLAFASAAAGAATLAACGGSSPTATPAATKPAATTAPAAASPTTAAAAATTAPTTAAQRLPRPLPRPPRRPAPLRLERPLQPPPQRAPPPLPRRPQQRQVRRARSNSSPGFRRSRWTTTSTATRTIRRRGEHLGTPLRYDQDFNILPDLAESYTNSGPVFTFKIRKDATWSDGQPIKAQDFVYSVDAQIDPRTGNGYGSFWDGVIKGAVGLLLRRRRTTTEPRQAGCRRRRQGGG